jgi:type VI secretion system protein ImpH
MSAMERESQLTFSELETTFGMQLPYTNFYRFMQWLEQRHPEFPPIGSTSQIKNDPVRFRPSPGMGFPASEFKGIELNPDDDPRSTPTVRTTFMGLYGVDSPLPTAYIDDITQRREGHEAVEHFLDIFNHRILTQFYRIWRRHNYPATFEPGGTDHISQCLLGIGGLGIPGTGSHLAAPLSRFLGILDMLHQPGKTVDGLKKLVQMVAPDTQVAIVPNYRRKVEVPEPCLDGTFFLDDRPVLGGVATDINSAVEIRLRTESKDDARGWMPPHQPLFHDLLSLLRVYLGWRYDAYITLTMPRRLFPAPRLSVKHNDEDTACIGYSFLLGQEDNCANPDPEMPDWLTVKLGWYEGLTKNPHQCNATEIDDEI